jgi:mRNA interferase RelE/StbE
MPARYRVIVLKPAARYIERLPRSEQKRVLDRLTELQAQPRPAGAKVLKGELAGHWRIRLGGYRILYAIEDDALVVQVVRIGHCREVYRRFDVASAVAGAPGRRMSTSVPDSTRRRAGVARLLSTAPRT